MRTYFIECLEGTGFGSWSYEDPPTRQKILEHFDLIRQTEGMDIPKRALSLRSIAYLWNVAITENKGEGQA